MSSENTVSSIRIRISPGESYGPTIYERLTSLLLPPSQQSDFGFAEKSGSFGATPKMSVSVSPPRRKLGLLAVYLDPHQPSQSQTEQPNRGYGDINFDGVDRPGVSRKAPVFRNSIGL